MSYRRSRSSGDVAAAISDDVISHAQIAGLEHATVRSIPGAPVSGLRILPFLDERIEGLDVSGCDRTPGDVADEVISDPLL